VGLLLGWAADMVLGDPPRFHPVAGFGRAAAALERRTYADSRAAGAAHVAVLVGAAVGVGALAERVRNPVARTLLTAVATWTVLGGTSLAGHGARLADELDTGDLAAARARIPSLCGRDPELLDAAGMARAGTESMAENTSDAVVAPLLWGAVAGAPGLLGHRAVNTLDAMIGYRSPRYRRFGWAAARLDDVVNWVPARVTVALVALAGAADAAVAEAAGALAGAPPSRQETAGQPLSGDPGPAATATFRAALRAARRDGHRHPSPNAGPVEAAWAGALGVALGGRTVYRHAVEERPQLGDGPPPNARDLRRAARLSRLVGGLAALIAATVAR
jgi:Cobalamin biosynthesis protein CobD/CbiB